MVKGLGLSISEKAVAHPDPRTALRSVLRAWLPLSEAILGAAVDQLPSPLVSLSFSNCYQYTPDYAKLQQYFRPSLLLTKPLYRVGTQKLLS